MLLRDTGHIGIHRGVDGATVVRSYGDQNQISRIDGAPRSLLRLVFDDLPQEASP